MVNLSVDLDRHDKVRVGHRLKRAVHQRLVEIKDEALLPLVALAHRRQQILPWIRVRWPYVAGGRSWLGRATNTRGPTV